MKKQKMARIESAPDMAINRIVQGTSMKGDIRCESNIRIDGQFEGTIHTKGRLVVGPTGIIKGDVICQDSEIEGTIRGNVQVSKLLALKSTSKVEGDIATDKLSIEPGATFTGTCNMGGKVKDIKPSESEARQEAAG